MLTLSPNLTARLPVRIDLGWMKSRDGSLALAGTDAAEMPENSVILSRILELNPTASPEFLGQFSAGELTAYLDHLMAASMPRGRFARRIRPDNTPGVMSRASAA